MLRILGIVYGLLYTGALLAYLPYYRWVRRERSKVDFAQRLWRTPQFPAAPDRPGPAFWVHAVSVGEVNAVEELVRRLLGGAARVYVTTTTDTGQEQARRLFVEQRRKAGRSEARVFYFPVDWQWLVKRILGRMRPQAVLLAETELWPGFLLAARSRKVPTLLINGRLSDASFRRYRRFRFLFSRLLRDMQAVCVQTLEDKKKVLELGAPEEIVHWTGNLKYDYSLPEDPERRELARKVRRLLARDRGDRVWVCGSTREGEEPLLAEALRKLRAAVEGLRMVLAPRHPHRCGEVARMLEERGYSVLKLSDMAGGGEGGAPPDVFLVDTIGDLRYLYEAADVVFVGGSLVERGGQNILEAAHFGKPVVFGPHMDNFREVARNFQQAYAALRVESVEELEKSLLHLLRDPAAADWLGRNARKVMRQSQGAVERTLEIVMQSVERRGGGANP